MKTKTNDDLFLYADENQRELYKKFPADSFLGNPKNLDHVFQWITFFRRNLHRFAIDYLGVKLHLYQMVILYLMGISKLVVIVASRAAAKSFIIAIYNSCMSILYPHSKQVMSSSTKGQAKLIVTDKISNELMGMSSTLRAEISKIKDNQNDVIVFFKNQSTIRVVPALESARGSRSNICTREEFRQIEKRIDDSILSPFQVIRQAPYMLLPEYADNTDLQEDSIDVYISSSWYDDGSHWMWGIVDQAYEEMTDGKDSVLLAFDESITLKHNIRTLKKMIREKKKQDPLTWRIEFLNERVKENESAFFQYSMFTKNQTSKQPWYPRQDYDVLAGRKNPYDIPMQPDEVRVVCCDIALMAGSKNDASVYTCARLIPEIDANNIKKYRMIVCYCESWVGKNAVNQAIRIHQLREDFKAHYIVMDTNGVGLGLFDYLTKVIYDENRRREYSPLSCMNDPSLAMRVASDAADPCIYSIKATQALNSQIAINFRLMLSEQLITFLVPLSTAEEEILNSISEYTTAPDADTQLFYERPFLETQAIINESVGLIATKQSNTGNIVIREQSGNRKDHYSSCSYLAYFCSELEKDLLGAAADYEYQVFIN